MGIFILRRHAAYLQHPCCTKSVGPCTPELPAVQIMFRRQVCPCDGMAGERRRKGLILMRVVIAEVGNWPDSALSPNVAGTGTLHFQGSFNTDPRSDLGDKAKMASDKKLGVAGGFVFLTLTPCLRCRPVLLAWQSHRALMRRLSSS